VPARGFASAGYARARGTALAGATSTAGATSAADTVRRGDPWPHERDALPSSCGSYVYPSATPGTDVAPADGASAVGVPETPSADDAGSYTSHLAVVDAEGNAVSATTTVGVLFGSGVYTDGFFLNSSGGNMDARTRGPNRYTNSTIAPTMVLDRGDVRLVIGAAGSQYIQPAITQVTIRILAFGEDPGRAIAAPRIQTTPARRDVEVEPGFSPEVYAGLVARGYRPVSRVADIQFGGIHGIYVRRDGTRIGIADPRRDGIAVKQ
jgi:gamma-glutamyltranspeptidase/glutathione hydrolase